LKVTRVLLADPYRDLQVIDSRAPRFNQLVVGLLALFVAYGRWRVAPLPSARPSAVR
jgi:hypothetical protein